jgi:hypothetical protein
VVISIELWDRFLQVMSSLTQWEELIREWAVSKPLLHAIQEFPMLVLKLKA